MLPASIYSILGKENSMYIYWVHLLEHDDVYHQGYVGISNNPKRRLRQHKTSNQNPHLYNAFKKYENNIIMTLIDEGDVEYCKKREMILRPFDRIGWNVVAGGGLPPSRLSKEVSVEARKNMSLAQLGKKKSKETINKMKSSLIGKNLGK